jgi:hypothetical protein
MPGVSQAVSRAAALGRRAAGADRHAGAEGLAVLRGARIDDLYLPATARPEEGLAAGGAAAPEGAQYA